ncbi:YihY/virulence factor BrkB family protein [Novosphingobium album (ex Hu et al. 2023)]|uniref:YihY/virulence factor BrkB family protein n=1 Tax=Novosphingobium album (ex Hu et al. 2023) TaxID=2930093 RepID=A0ABT0B469_9SPHN|nr:YihY/virulence factor BrkB family protein [Novosphingobium album (ex Hu et al. 2023)]MCJ2179839.1 YihY/virulence factor BrkB family protein [Novosphingobium album (ex Hu et al. 2023)]
MKPAGPPDLSPEGRRREALLEREGLRQRIRRRAGPGSHVFAVVMRVAGGAWKDGFIHAGNLAYMTLLALFPFFIALAAIFSAIGEKARLDASIDAVLRAMPPRVAEVLGPVAHDVVAARHGWLLWIGGLFGLWTATSLIETIRDILHRAYGTSKRQRYWRYRLFSTGLIFGAVLLLLISLSSQVLIAAMQAIIFALFPQFDTLSDQIAVSGMISAGALFGSIYMLFYLLTPAEYQTRIYPKWPGAALVTAWWLLVAFALPKVLHNFFVYDLTYGSLAGVMIALFFFWLVGLGMVVGAELNAALAESPEERDMFRRSTAASGPNDNETREEHE